MTSLYIASSHSFQEQPDMEKPEAPPHRKCYGDHQSDYERDVYNYRGNLEIYNKHIKCLCLIPCRPGDKWQEGVLYEEGKDYEISEAQFVVNPDFPILQATHFIIPIASSH